MTVLASIVALPFLLWSWLRGGNEEDADLAAGLIGWMAISATATVVLWYMFW